MVFKSHFLIFRQILWIFWWTRRDGSNFFYFLAKRSTLWGGVDFLLAAALLSWHDLRDCLFADSSVTEFNDFEITAYLQGASAWQTESFRHMFARWATQLFINTNQKTNIAEENWRRRRLHKICHLRKKYGQIRVIFQEVLRSNQAVKLRPIR